jgi:hypothetical protein
MAHLLRQHQDHFISLLQVAEAVAAVMMLVLDRVEETLAAEFIRQSVLMLEM